MLYSVVLLVLAADYRLLLLVLPQRSADGGWFLRPERKDRGILHLDDDFIVAEVHRFPALPFSKTRDGAMNVSFL